MKTNIYFEPPSRLQLLEKLQHLVRFSDFLLLISGDRGAGKSTLLAQLLPEQSDSTLCCCFIKPIAEISSSQLLAELSNSLPAHEAVGTDFADQLKAFHQQIKAMKASGKKCLIIVDDSEYLSNEALALLLNLHATDVQLILMSENDYAAEVMTSETVKHMEGRVHHVMIDGMSDEETLEYLQVCHPALSSLPEKKKLELVRLSEGMPGRIETLLAGGKVATSPQAKRATAFPLPPMHMAGIGIVLIGIVAASLWQFMPESPDESAQVVDVGERVSVPLAVKASDESVTELKVSESVAVEKRDAEVNQPAETAKNELARRLQEQEDKLKQKNIVTPAPLKPEDTLKQDVIAKEAKLNEPTKIANKVPSDDLEAELREVVIASNDSSKQESAPGSLAQDVTEKVVAVETTQSPKKAPNKKAAVEKPSKSLKSEAFLLGLPDSNYTLQMLGARSKQSALDFMGGQPDPSLFYYFSTIYKGKPWHVVVYGSYPNRDVANAAIRKLPAALQKTKPWARSIKGVQLDIRKK